MNVALKVLQINNHPPYKKVSLALVHPSPMAMATYGIAGGVMYASDAIKPIKLDRTAVLTGKSV